MFKDNAANLVCVTASPKTMYLEPLGLQHFQTPCFYNHLFYNLFSNNVARNIRCAHFSNKQLLTCICSTAFPNIMFMVLATLCFVNDVKPMVLVATSFLKDHLPKVLANDFWRCCKTMVLCNTCHDHVVKLMVLRDFQN